MNYLRVIIVLFAASCAGATSTSLKIDDVTLGNDLRYNQDGIITVFTIAKEDDDYRISYLYDGKNHTCLLKRQETTYPEINFDRDAYSEEQTLDDYVDYLNELGKQGFEEIAYCLPEIEEEEEEEEESELFFSEAELTVRSLKNLTFHGWEQEVDKKQTKTNIFVTYSVEGQETRNKLLIHSFDHELVSQLPSNCIKLDSKGHAITYVFVVYNPNPNSKVDWALANNLNGAKKYSKVKASQANSYSYYEGAKENISYSYIYDPDFTKDITNKSVYSDGRGNYYLMRAGRVLLTYTGKRIVPTLSIFWDDKAEEMWTAADEGPADQDPEDGVLEAAVMDALESMIPATIFQKTDWRLEAPQGAMQGAFAEGVYHHISTDKSDAGVMQTWQHRLSTDQVVVAGKCFNTLMLQGVDATSSYDEKSQALRNAVKNFKLGEEQYIDTIISKQAKTMFLNEQRGIKSLTARNNKLNNYFDTFIFFNNLSITHLDLQGVKVGEYGRDLIARIGRLANLEVLNLLHTNLDNVNTKNLIMMHLPRLRKLHTLSISMPYYSSGAQFMLSESYNETRDAVDRNVKFCLCWTGVLMMPFEAIGLAADTPVMYHAIADIYKSIARIEKLRTFNMHMTSVTNRGKDAYKQLIVNRRANLYPQNPINITLV